MKIALAIALWLAASPLFAWLAGRFIRVGMVELQPQQVDHIAEEAA